MSEHKKELEKKLWAVANELRGNMGADEFRDYILGFIFFKFLSEKIEDFANEELKEDGITFLEASKDSELMEELKEAIIDELGYFIEPKYLFHNLSERARNKEYGGRVCQTVYEKT